MMQMLRAGGIPALTDEVRAADEDNPRGYLEFERVKRIKQDTAWLDEAAGKVVKMVHLLLYDLPPDRPYRIVFMRRDLDEVLASQRKMLDRQGKQGAAIARRAVAEGVRGPGEEGHGVDGAQPNMQGDRGGIPRTDRGPRGTRSG